MPPSSPISATRPTPGSVPAAGLNFFAAGRYAGKCFGGTAVLRNQDMDVCIPHVSVHATSTVTMTFSLNIEQSRHNESALLKQRYHGFQLLAGLANLGSDVVQPGPPTWTT